MLCTHIQIDNISDSTVPLFYSPCWFPVDFPFYSPLLNWKPSFGVMRSCPPWSQVARKLISLSPNPPQSLPNPNSRPPSGFPQQAPRFTKTTSRSRLPRSGTIINCNIISLLHHTPRICKLGFAFRLSLCLFLVRFLGFPELFSNSTPSVFGHHQHGPASHLAITRTI